MADLTITAANIKNQAPGANEVSGTAGETFAQGDAMYLKQSDTKWWKADADAAATAVASGIALNSGLADNPITLITAGGDLNFGAILTVGELYIVSVNPGKIAPFSDLASGDSLRLVGYGKTTSIMGLLFIISGVVKP